MDRVKEFFGIKEDPNNPPPPPPEPEHKIPHEMATWITFRCFDACVGNLNDKILANSEIGCIKECAEHLKAPAVAYQQM
jgi:hypothetical protein